MEMSANFTNRPLYHGGKTSVAIGKGAQSWSGRFGENNIVPRPGFELIFVHPLASLFTEYTVSVPARVCMCVGGKHAVAQLLVALRYKPEGHGFDSR